MAISERDIRLSGKSYTNKDFGSIYRESVETVQGLTNRWNPRTSNESDPGVVLLKDSSFKADKLNYNVDKNVLEVFMPTCTQEASMRMNCASRGYDMKYYMASEVTLSFVLSGSDITLGENGVVLDRFDTTVSNQEGSIYYVLVSSVGITELGKPFDGIAIQGTLESLTVSGNDGGQVQLSNLDDQNRLFFPVANVAQNGVFITDGTYEWECVSNLNTQATLSRVFKFGYDSSRGLPFIEFPSDVASLIGDGLYVKYVVTDGVNGMVPAYSLTKVASVPSELANGNETISIVTEGEGTNISVYNASSSVGGADPETIDEAYSNYKKTIGTFDSLVTCRDYANSIYFLNDSDGLPMVSNVQVADRRSDINGAVSVISFDLSGQCRKNVTYTGSAGSTGSMSASDLRLYPLNPMLSTTSQSYVASFKRLEDTMDIEDAIEDAKSLSHDYLPININDIVLIKNMAKLNATIFTKWKVGDAEASAILVNVRYALMDAFNSRKLDYGTEIPYDVLLNVMENADERISQVSLNEPEQRTVYVRGDGTEVSQESLGPDKNGYEYSNVVLARNILTGRVPLFDYDDDFAYDFGQTDSGKDEGIATISTEVPVEVVAETAYTMQANEAIQFISPEMVLDDDHGPYGYGVQWCWESQHDVGTGKIYELGEDDVLYTRRVDTEGNVVVETFEEGTIIRPTGSLTLGGGVATEPGESVSRPSGSTQYTLKDVGDKYMFMLGANDGIDILKVNKVELQETRKCYWLTNNSTNALFHTTGNESITLRDGEYFFYLSPSENAYYYLGSGSTISKTGMPSDIEWELPRVSLSDILENGVQALKEACVQLNFTSSQYVTVTSNEIITLKSGDSVTFKSIDTDSELHTSGLDTIGNTPLGIGSSEVKYNLDGKDVDLPARSPSFGYKVRSRLDINAGPGKPQKRLFGQTITFKDKDGNPSAEQPAVDGYFELSRNTELAGDSSIDVSEFDPLANGGNGATVYPLSAYVYGTETIQNFSRVNTDYPVVALDSTDTDNDSIELPVPSVGTEKAIWMVYWSPSGNATLSITSTATPSGPTVRFYNGTHSGTSLGTISDEGIYNIEIDAGVDTITLECTSGKGNVIIDRPRFHKGFNPTLGIESLVSRVATLTAEDIEDDLLDKLQTMGGDTFYYGNVVSGPSHVDSDDLSDPISLYDSHNFANGMVLEEIDLDSSASTITISRSSRK